MVDYRDYVSFEVAEWAAAHMDPEKVVLRGSDRQNIERALQEIASTPEGAALIANVASRSADGKMTVLSNDGGYTLAFTPNLIAIGTHDSDFRYYSHETGQFHDMSLQRLLYHEMQHIAHNHTHINLESEAEAVRATNIFMAKYYGEPARDPDTRKGSLDTGTPQWDINPNFTPSLRHASAPEAMREHLGGLDASQIARLGPEAQSLFEFRDDPARFAAQFSELEQSGGITLAMEDVSQAEPASPGLRDQPALQPAPAWSGPKLG